MEGNTEALNKGLSEIGTLKIKLLMIKRYNGLRTGLKGYLIQILLKIRTKASKLNIIGDAVIYIEMFLLG